MNFFNIAFLKNFLLIFFSTLMTLVFLEVLLRVTGSPPSKKDNLVSISEPTTNKPSDKLGWVPKTGVHVFKPWDKKGKKTTLTINSDGSRKSGKQNKQLNKIIFIGGSLTQGWAVDDKETFAFILQKKIKNYEILNFGVGGYGGYQSLLMLEKIFKDKNNIKNVFYGFIPHHEVRNVAAGSWLYLLNNFSSRGIVNVPFASLNKDGTLSRNKPTKYFKLPFGENSSLIAKIEKKIMKLNSFNRERDKTLISLMIIQEMNDLSKKNNSDFSVIFLDKFKDNRAKKYQKFFKEKKISSFECLVPQGEKFIVPGDGHPNEISHEIISDCIMKRFN